MELTTLQDIEDAGGKIVSLKQQIEFIANRYAPSEFDALRLKRLRSSLRSAKRALKKKKQGDWYREIGRCQHEIAALQFKYKPSTVDERALLRLRADLQQATRRMKELTKHIPRLPAF